MKLLCVNQIGELEIWEKTRSLFKDEFEWRVIFSEPLMTPLGYSWGIKRYSNDLKYSDKTALKKFNREIIEEWEE